MTTGNEASQPTAGAETSSRGLVLFLLASALGWLGVGLALSLAASLRLHHPAFLGAFSWTAYGRLEAAGRDAYAYGFALQAGLALTLWIAARFAEAKIPAQGLAGLSAVFWNAGVAVGVIGLLAGESTGLRWIEFPKEAWLILLLSYLFLASWGVAAFAQRGQSDLPPGLWYGFGALFAGGWILGTVAVLAHCPLRGVSQALAAGWCSQGLQYLWLTPLALGVLYALLTASSGRPLKRPTYAALGFWGWFLLAGWTGATPLVGGPVPAWAPTVSIAAAVLLSLPVVLILVNLVGAFSPGKLCKEPAAPWLVAATLAFAVVGLGGAVTAPRCAQRILHFTLFPTAMEELALYGFVGCALLGGVYAAVPRLTGQEWPCRILAGFHLLASVGGLALVVAVPAIAGFWQGFRLDNPWSDFNAISHKLLWVHRAHTAGLFALLAGQAALTVSLGIIASRLAKPFREPVLQFVVGTLASFGVSLRLK